MKVIQFILAFALFLFLSQHAVCSATRQKDKVQFKNISVNDGLSQSTVNCILQDSIGYLWFGTRSGGLNRFDGYTFKQYNRSVYGDSVLQSDEILCLAEGNFQDLYFGTEDAGIYIINRSTEKISHFFLEESITCLYFEKNTSSLWIGTNKGLFIKSAIIDDNPGALKIINNEVISSIQKSSGNNIIVSSNRNLYIFNEQAQILTKLELDQISKDETLYRNYSVVDNDDSIWIVNTKGLWQTSLDNPDNLSNRYLFSSPEEIEGILIRSIVCDIDNNLWIGTNRGLVFYETRSNKSTNFFKEVNNPNSLCHNSVYSLIADNEGNIWTGTWSGISMISNKLDKFRHIKHIDYLSNSLSNNMVSSFEESSEGIWIGTEQGGLNLLGKENERFLKYQYANGKTSDKRDHIKSLYIDSRKNLWIGTFGMGVRKRDISTEKEINYLRNTRVFSFTEYPKGILWAGSISGLYKMNLNGEILKVYNTDTIKPGSLHNNFITCLFGSKKNKQLWVGSRKGGAALYLPKIDDFKVFRQENSPTSEMESNYVICIVEDNIGRIWIGTDFGLYFFDQEKQSFHKPAYLSELYNYMINGIVFDEQNNLWVSTNHGVFTYNYNTNALHKFKLSDGLQSQEFNRGAFFKSGDGTIYFGGINGFNIIDPQAVLLNPAVSKPVIKSLKTADKTINLEYLSSKSITLKHSQNDLEIDFVALSYINPEDNNYSHILKGYDQTWSQAHKSRSVSYTNLPPGEFTFSLRVSNNDNIWNEQIKEFHIKINPPYWKTTWAYIFYVFLVALILFLMRRATIARHQQKMQLEYERNQKQQIKQLNEMKLRYFTNISHEFRTPLTLIRGPLAELEKIVKRSPEADEFITLINRNVNRLLNLIGQLLDFRKVEKDLIEPKIKEGELPAFLDGLISDFSYQAKEKNIGLTSTIDSKLASTFQWYDPYIIDKIIFNLLSNAFKFTPEEGKISIRTVITKDAATITVSDTGEGIKAEELDRIFERFYSSKNLMKHSFSGSGIGLALSKRLIELHSGTVSVNSEPGKGSAFTIHFPINEDDYSSIIILPEIKTNPIREIKEDIVVPPGSKKIKYANTILLVEDNLELLGYLEKLLKPYYAIEKAQNGIDALKIADQKSIDLVLSDIMMPKMDGIEFSKQLHGNMATSHIPVLFLTAKTSADDISEGLETGALDYLTKPFNPNDLILKTQNILKNRKLIFEKMISSKNNSAKPEKLLSLDERFLKDTYDALRINFPNPSFNIESLSAMVNLSRSQLHRKFKALTGKSPSEVLIEIRMTAAKKLVDNKSYSISEVAYKTGYNNLSVFSEAFKNKFGENPSQINS